jgi:hypothetical protein
MKASTQLVRGTPVYVRRGSDTIALVPEVEELEFSPRPGGPLFVRSQVAAVYVMDETGVRRLAVRDVNRRAIALPLLGVLATWLQYVIFGRLRRGGRFDKTK